MKACVLQKKQDILFTEVQEPGITRPDQVKLKILRAGICGSDMHYYNEGSNGPTCIVQHPFILGHEAVGVVTETGNAVTKVAKGDQAVVLPSHACYDCELCRKGLHTYCTHLTHSGSASTNPHTDGLFAEYVVVHESQAFAINGCSSRAAAFAEPLSVAINGVKRIDHIVGRNILIMGAGPIGILCAAVAKRFGAGTVTVLDVRSQTLDVALAMGADVALNMLEHPEQVAQWKENKGHFDHMIEASGNARALVDGMNMCLPESTCVQVGVFSPGKEPRDFGPFLTKGIKWKGVFRCFDEFATSADMLRRGYIQPEPLLTAAFTAEDCDKAMQSAGGADSIKVQLVFSETK